MAKKKKPKLPPGVRRHGAGYRAVVSVGRGERARSPTLLAVDDVVKWIAQFRAAKSLPFAQPLTVTLTGALALILEDLRATGARVGTFEYYKAHARTLFLHLGAETLLHRIDKDALLAFVRKRMEARVLPATIVRKELGTLKRMRVLALAAGYLLPLDPFDGLRLPRVRTGRFEVMTRERVLALLVSMRAYRAPLARWQADVVEVLFNTGLRRAELCRLRVRDIDFDSGRIFVDGKTKDRHQTFGRLLEPVLRRLVTAARAGALVRSVDSIEQMFSTWQKRLGEPRLKPHCLRHSYGTEMARHVSPFDLMGLMGHSSLTQTSRYFHASGDAVRAALDSLQPDSPSPAPPSSAPPTPSTAPPTQP